MNYLVCINIDEKVKILDRYPTEEQALKRLKYHVKKEKCILEVIPVPELKIGCRIYNEDGSYYGNIIYETNNLWGISSSGKGDGMPDPYSKQRIEQWILSKNLIVVDGEDIPEVDTMLEKVETLKVRVSEILKSLEHLYTEQITIFK